MTTYPESTACLFSVHTSHYILSHIHTPVFHLQLAHNPSTRCTSMFVALPLVC